MDKTGLLEGNLGELDERDAGRLSTHHIRSQEVGYEPARLVFYPEGSLATAVRELVVKVCDRCGETFKVETYRQEKVFWCPTCRRGEVTWTRGEITRFSERSRLRLMRILNMVRNDVHPLFTTLTYPDEFAPYHLEPDKWKRDIRAFEHRFRRAFPEASFIWRLEVIDRKSGQHTGSLFPHFHLLVFGVQLGLMREFVGEHWHEIAGNGSAAHYKVHSHPKAVTPVISRRGIMRYASKTMGRTMSAELGKSIQAMGKRVGRWWGIIVRDVFETYLAEPEEYELWDKDAVTLQRYFRKLQNSQAVGRWRRAGKFWKKPKEISFSLRSLTTFLDGGFIERNLLRMLSPPARWKFKATGRKYNVPFWKWAYETGRWKPEMVSV